VQANDAAYGIHNMRTPLGCMLSCRKSRQPTDPQRKIQGGSELGNRDYMYLTTTTPSVSSGYCVAVERCTRGVVCSPLSIQRVYVEVPPNKTHLPIYDLRLHFCQV
jgi:hypothetical protein